MRSRTSWLMLAPSLLVLGVLFAGGLVLAAAQSLRADGQWTGRYYEAVLTDREFHRSLMLTLYVAASSTLISAMAGALIAAALWRQRASRVLLQLPVATPHLAMAIAVIHLIAPSGLIARAGYAMNWVASPAEFPALTNDAFGVGIILVYCLKETPFLAVICVAVLMRTGENYQEVARTLGASAWQRTVHVTLPLVLPALAAGSVAVFAYVFSAFEVPFLLGRPYPAMLGVVAQRRFMDTDLVLRPEAIAIAMLSAVVSLAAVWCGFRLLRGRDMPV